MAHEEKLPLELIEEILSRVPPKSLVCFRTVSKKWKALFDEKMFINNHKSTFRFILTTKSKIYSVNIDPEIVVRELTLDIPGLGSQMPKNLIDCNDFLLCRMDKVVAVWNPCLKQTRLIKKIQPGLQVDSVGDDSNTRVENVYKVMLTCWKELDTHWTIADLAASGVPLHGKLYCVALSIELNQLYHVYEFDFPRKNLFKFCDLPCQKNHPRDVLVLGGLREDRLTLLKQCHETKKIEIWVTRNKINYDDVVWMNFMQVSIPNLPDLVHTGSDDQPSYFIDDKRVVVCCCDETGRAWIYVLGENKLVSKIKIDSVVDNWPLHSTYSPSLVPVPRGPREEAELQVNNGPVLFGEVENDKESGAGGGGRGRKKAARGEEEGNVSDRGEEDEEEEASRKSRLGLNKKSNDDDEEGPKPAPAGSSRGTPSAKPSKGKRKLNDADAKKSSSSIQKKVKTENDSKSSVKEEKPTPVSKSNTPSKFVKAESSSAPAASSSATTPPVTEEEIRAVLMERKHTTNDLVSRFKARLKSKEDKDAFAAILRRISKIQKNSASEKFVVLREK